MLKYLAVILLLSCGPNGPTDPAEGPCKVEELGLNKCVWLTGKVIRCEAADAGGYFWTFVPNRSC